MENGIVVIGLVFIFVFLIVPLAGFLWVAFFNKEDEKTPGGMKGCLQLVLCAIIVVLILAAVGHCSGGNWQPRHTQNVKPAQINVNTIIFSA